MPLNSSRPYWPHTITLVILLFLILGLVCSKGQLQNHSSLIISFQECSALAQLAKQSNLSTNCNCTQQLAKTNSSLEQCGAYNGRKCPITRQHFARCTHSGNAPLRELYLSNVSLQGDLRWVTSFRHIKLLDVSLNNLSGGVPSAIWSLSKLIYVNLSFNSFVGHIPDFNTNGSAVLNYPLSTLDFSHNQLRGPFPQNLCTRFPNLTHLSLSSNHFNGFANFSLCQKLEVLDASFNQLQGSPLHHLQASSSLKSLKLKHNLFNGSLPSLSWYLPQLIDLDASFNHFAGRFGSENSSLPLNLSKLDVSHNSLEVGFSPQIIFRFGVSSFWPNTACKGCFNSSVTSPSPSAPTAINHSPPSKRNDFSITHRLDAILGIIGGCMAGFFLITILTCLIINKRRQKSTWPLCPGKRPPPPFQHAPPEVGPFSFESQSGTWVADVKDPSSVPVVIFEKPLMNLTFADLLQATKSFDREYEVGDGTGLVYACVLPRVLEANDAKVTIEVVKDGPSLSAEAAHAAFMAMGEIKHDNLVPLLGYCIVGEEKLLIYKHMEGGVLEDVLHIVPEEGPLPNASAISAEDWNNIESWPDHNELQQSCVPHDIGTSLDWETRHKIALGVARALAYLHNGYLRSVVHGALSSSCILLDASRTEATVANYGGAWGLRRELTPGYVAPECAKENAHMAASQSSKWVEHARTSNGDVHAYTTKCDVYGMGVVLLELATGRRAVGNYDAATTLVAWVRALKKGKRAEEGVDPRLLVTSHPHVLEMMNVGYLCTADSPSKRPSMQQVVGLLKDLATVA